MIQSLFHEGFSNLTVFKTQILLLYDTRDWNLFVQIFRRISLDLFRDERRITYMCQLGKIWERLMSVKYFKEKETHVE